VLGAHSIENTVAAQDHEVMVDVTDLNVVDLRVNDDHVRVSTVFLHLSLAVSEGPRDGKAARDNTHRALGDRSSWSCKHDIIILIDLASSLKDTPLFGLFAWFMVIGNRYELAALDARHHGTGVASVPEPDVVVDYQHYDGARPGLVSHLHQVLSHESFLGFLKALNQGLFRIRREARLVGDYVMQIISQEFSAAMASVAVEHCEE